MARARLAIVALIIGVGMVGYAGYYGVSNHLTHYGQAHYAMANVTEVPASQVTDPSTVVAYESLPTPGQLAFDAARSDESHRLWDGDNRRTIRALSDHTYIRYQGEYYQYLLLVGHKGNWEHILLTTGLIGFSGVVLAGIGAWRVRRSPAG